MQCLKQRAGIIPEDIGHLASCKTRLDNVITFGAPGPALDVDGHVWMQRRICFDERFGRILAVLAVVNKVDQRDGSRGFLSGSGGGFSELTSVASRSLLTGNEGGFSELVLVGSRSLLTGSGDDFTALAFIGCRSADGGAST